MSKQKKSALQEVKKTQNIEENEFSKNVEMLKFFQEEFFYRHKQYWEILIKLFILDVFVIAFPLVSEISGIVIKDVKEKYLWAFPILGIAIAFLSFLIIKDEAKKISAVNKAKYRINQKMPPEYQYEKYVDDMKNKKKQLALKMPYIVFGIEIILSLFVLSILGLFEKIFS